MTRDDDWTEISAEPGRPHWPALDGLRGSAVVAVLICHYSAMLPRGKAWVGVLEIGWAGVDLFFVLSGFLITGILLDAKGTPHSFRNFYARRILRIFPLYYGFLAVTLLATLVRYMTSGSDGLHQLWAAQPWLWTHTANHWLAAQTAWTPWAEIAVPLWSLSVEEQFYLVWPLVVLGCSQRTLIRVCIGIFVGALVLRLVLTLIGVHWFTLYVMTPTRADALAAGALLAAIVRLPDGRRLARKCANYAGPVAAILLIVLSRGFDPTRHPWQRVYLYSALAVFFAALLVWAMDATSLRGVPNRFYNLRVLRAIGRYSYGIYVLHLPLYYITILAAARWRLFDPNHPTWASALLLVGVNAVLCGALAVVSFEFFEKPILNMKRFFPATSTRRPATLTAPVPHRLPETLSPELRA